jgi:hypothetical protein
VGFFAFRAHLLPLFCLRFPNRAARVSQVSTSRRAAACPQLI